GRPNQETNCWRIRRCRRLAWVPGRKDRRAGRSRTNYRRRFVGIDSDEFVVTVRTDVADSQNRVRREFPLDPQRPRNQSRGLHVRLDAPRNQFRTSWDRSSRIDRKLRNREVRDAIGWIERSILVCTIAERILKIVVHSESR